MNPHTAHPTSPFALTRSIWQNRELIFQMIKRDVVGRYKGSLLGLGWSFFNPVLMLTVYTFVFSVVFKARWGTVGEANKTEFAVILFVGLIIHALFAEVINRAPGLILGNVNYVKKVIFPLEILPVVSMGAALFHALISIGVLLGAFALMNGFVHWVVLLIPIIFLPFILITVGFAWLLASLGVYLRDVGQTIGIITTVMLFLAPVFYPMSALPEKYQNYLLINPLTFIIEQSRQVLIFGKLPDWRGLAVYTAISLVVAWVGYWWFQKTRKGFADVV
ncbi:MAG TPA: ABC transporter permease [Gammaproteobacteria bacterium]|nr:ABC transporter permease [Gammaproteobacteria bacterium]